MSGFSLPEKRFCELLFDKSNYEDDAVHSLLMKHPELARKEYLFPDPCYPDNYPDIAHQTYPLVQALSCGASFDVIKLLYEAYPAAVKEKNYYGTPLLRACYYRASPEVVRFLFDANPEAAKEKDGVRMYPLHYACESGASLDVVRFLFDAHPGAVKEKDYGKRYPLHYAAGSKGASLELVQFLFHGYPPAAKEKDDDQRYPLHVAVCSHRASLEVVRFLYNAHPAAANEKDSLQMYPVHEACYVGTSLEVVRFLYNAYPDAIKENDCKRMMPLHRAIGARKVSLQLVQFLLEAYPDAVQKQNDVGKTPRAMIDEFMLPICQDVVDCLEIIHTFVNLNNPTDEELCDIFRDFHSMAWWGGVMLVINAYPSIIHKLNFDLSIMPDIFAKIGRVSNAGVFFEVMKGLPDMMKDVSL